MDNNQYNDQFDTEFDLKTLYQLLINNILIIIISTVLLTILGTIYVTQLVTPKYTAKTTLIVQVEDNNDVLMAQRLMQTYIGVINSEKTLSTASSTIADINNSQLKSGLSVSVVRDSLFISITFEHARPETAHEVVNKVAQAAITVVNNTVNDIPEYPALHGNLVLHDEATIPSSPSSPNVQLTIIISFLLGGMLGVLIVFLKEAFSDTFKNSQEIERVLGIPVVAVIPEYDMDEE